MKLTIWVFWPSFIAAGIAESIFFTLFDPKQLYLFGNPVQFSPLATYSIGFLLFWMLCASTSLLTWFMLPPSVKRGIDRDFAKR